jgi:hypothetical protein
VAFPSGALVYEREWLTKFQHTCVDAPPQLKPVGAVVCAPAEQAKLRAAAFAAQLEREKANAAQKKELKIRPGKRGVEDQQQQGQQQQGLAKGEDRWLPSAQDKKKPSRTLEQSFLSNLNKLTLENFPLLSKQLIELVRTVQSSPQLAAVVSLVFDKALAEPKFAAMYAQLCVILAAHAPWFENLAEKTKVSFRSELLNRAQDEFELEHVDDLAQFIKSQLRSATAEELDDAAAKYRARKLGNIKFIGELYKLQLLSGATLRAGILEPLLKTALAPATAASDLVRAGAAEKLTKLLGTIGETIEQRDIAVAETYFLAIRDLSTQKDVSSRVHFLLLNLLELRNNKWVARRKPDAPQRIGELHADAHAADADFAYLLPADLVSGMAKTVASLPAPSGKPSRTEVTSDWVLWLPGGAGAASSSAADSDTGSSAETKKKGKSVAFSEPVASPEDRIAALVAELFSSHDTDEAVTAFGELTPKDDTLNVEHVVRAAVEQTAPAIPMLAKFLLALEQKKAVPRDTVAEAARNIVADIADTAIDFPSAPKFITQLLRELHAAKLLDGPKLIAASGLDAAWQKKLKDGK